MDAEPIRTAEKPPRTEAAPRKSALPTILLGALLVAGLVVGAVLLFGPDREEQRSSDDAAYATAPLIEATALATAWKANGKAYDEENRWKALAVSGEVLSTEVLDSQPERQTSVVLKGLDGAEIDVRVDPDHASGVQGLKAGDKVTLVGRYAGASDNGTLVLRSARRR